MERIYIAIDLKSFYASVECIYRGLDPLTTNLVVADPSRTEKTICLAVSPSLKSYGIGSRARLFEVIQDVKKVNNERLKKIRPYSFKDSSYDINKILADPYTKLDYITAVPQMKLYMKYSAQIYNIYLKYISSEDIHVYSIDEVFIDVTSYLSYYKCDAQTLAMMLIKDVLKQTGLTTTCGIGTNLYLAKVAMDIVAKHAQPDGNGVRMAYLDEMKYRQLLWEHTPITDFWRIGPGYTRRLAKYGLYTMGDVAAFSLKNEDVLYKEFGINAELLIDHAWGYESCTMEMIKAYKPVNNSISNGQVLHAAYDYDKALLVIKEMSDAMCLDLVSKGLITDQISLYIGYDIENLTNPKYRKYYQGEVLSDGYGRNMPVPSYGSYNLEIPTNSSTIIKEAMVKLFNRIVDSRLLVRRINLCSTHVYPSDLYKATPKNKQLSLFEDDQKQQVMLQQLNNISDKDLKMQKALLQIKRKFGKNAILKTMDLEEGATTIDRNNQVGGHKA